MPENVTDFLPFHKALIEEEEIQEVLEVLRSGWLTTGPRVREFESAFAAYVQAEYAVALNSCTAALHLALAAIGLSRGDEVILPTMTFAASGEAVLYFGAKPVLVDSGEKSFHMDPDQVEQMITPRTRAIMPVHYAGYPCEMDSILAIARKHNLKIIEDAAHALPSRYRGRMVGSIGDITCFSFYATKTLTTGEGGMATTGNEEYANRMRMLSLHGISRDAWKRYTADGTWRYEIQAAGYKYNLTDIAAALGLAQLPKCDKMRRRREDLAFRYAAHLCSSDAFELPVVPSEGEHAWHIYPVRVNPAALHIGRDQVIEELKRRGIGTSVHFIPLHLHPLYQSGLGYRLGQFPRAECHFERAISLPIYPSMTDQDSDRVIQAMNDIERTFRR